MLLYKMFIILLKGTKPLIFISGMNLFIRVSRAMNTDINFFIFFD
jgi:hypothetical protein